MRLLHFPVLLLAALLLPGALTGAAHAQYEVIAERTTIILSASGDPAAHGRVTLTAGIKTDQGAGVADGRITFFDLTTMRVLGWTGVGQPRLVVDGLGAGRHSLRADYSGSAALLPVVVLPSQSAEIVLDVRAEPGLTLSSSEAVTAPGQLVTFNVAVAGGAGVPGGSVTIRDGDNVIAAHLPLDHAGTAAFVTSALTEGAHRIVAEYEGDANYGMATAQIDQRVSMTVASAAPRM